MSTATSVCLLVPFRNSCQSFIDLLCSQYPEDKQKEIDHQSLYWTLETDLNLGLSVVTTLISISFDLKSAERTLDRQVIAAYRERNAGS